MFIHLTINMFFEDFFRNSLKDCSRNSPNNMSRNPSRNSLRGFQRSFFGYFSTFFFRNSTFLFAVFPQIFLQGLKKNLENSTRDTFVNLEFRFEILRNYHLGIPPKFPPNIPLECIPVRVFLCKILLGFLRIFLHDFFREFVLGFL